MPKIKSVQTTKITNFYEKCSEKKGKLSTKETYLQDLRNQVNETPTADDVPCNLHIGATKETNGNLFDDCNKCTILKAEISDLKENLARQQQINAEERESSKELKKKYYKMCESNSKLTIKLDSLTQFKQILMESNMTEDNKLLSADEIRSLYGISGTKKNDSKFLRKCLEMRYKDNIGALQVRSVRGVQRKDDEDTIHIFKIPISPDKIVALNHQFKQRINRFETSMSAEEFSQRLSERNVNQLLARAIYNINEKIKGRPVNHAIIPDQEFIAAGGYECME